MSDRSRVVPLARAIRWRAPKVDGIAHAYPGAARALCGIRNTPERFDHPRTSKCPICVAAAS